MDTHATTATEEGVEIAPEVLAVLDRVSGGDLRKAITTLQSAVRLKGSPIAAQTLLDVSSSVPQQVTQGLYDACCEPSFGKVQSYVQDMIAEGYPVRAWWCVACMVVYCMHGGVVIVVFGVHTVLDDMQVLHVMLDLQRLVLERSDVADDRKAAICRALAIADKDLVDGSDEMLQMLSVASNTQRILAGVPVST